MTDWMVFAVTALFIAAAIWIVVNRLGALSDRGRRIIKMITLLSLILWLLKLVEAYI